ncbi:MAG TPA: DUF4230 domain-containing protein [Saprospiraceae bacterium]|nr:DUF4230 domain-containing protein [Saprospiraceae bacterium]HMP24267.1 DUF4230 domain-containing protein [Saprospiraceae bacterium]
MLRKILIGLGIVGVFALGILVTRYFYQSQQIRYVENSDVVLEKVKTVAKLISVEGYFTEVYDYKDYWGYDLSWFRKKALVRVKARVSVGYDLAQLKIDALPEERTIVVSNLPDPIILSIDHDLDYYDISQGTFNYFSEQDYNRINTNAKQFIEAKALESDLIATARKEGNQVLELMRFIAESAGWKFVVRTEAGGLEKLLN